MLLAAVVKSSEADVVFAQELCTGYIRRLSNPTSCTALLCGGLLLTNNTIQFLLELLDKIIYITGALLSIPTKAFCSMLNCLPNVLLAKQAAKLAAIRFNALPLGHTVDAGHSTPPAVDLVAL